jgi:hypothetical protein
MDEAGKPHLTVEEWSIAAEVDNLLDLYASDRVHVRFAAVRGKLMGLVDTTGPRRPQLVTWKEVDGGVDDVHIKTGTPWTSWTERAAVRDQLTDAAIDLIAEIRAETHGEKGRGYFIIWRLS